MVQQCQAAIVAAQSTFETIVENPLLAVLKFDTNEAQATRDLRLPLFNYPARAPKGKPAMENLISHVEIGLGVSHIHRPSSVSAPWIRVLICDTGASWIESDPFAFSPTSGGSKTTDRDGA